MSSAHGNSNVESFNGQKSLNSAQNPVTSSSSHAQNANMLYSDNQFASLEPR